MELTATMPTPGQQKSKDAPTPLKPETTKEIY